MGDQCDAEPPDCGQRVVRRPRRQPQPDSVADMPSRLQPHREEHHEPYQRQPRRPGQHPQSESHRQERRQRPQRRIPRPTRRTRHHAARMQSTGGVHMHRHLAIHGEHHGQQQTQRRDDDEPCRRGDAQPRVHTGIIDIMTANHRAHVVAGIPSPIVQIQRCERRAGTDQHRDDGGYGQPRPHRIRTPHGIPFPRYHRL